MEATVQSSARARSVAVALNAEIKSTYPDTTLVSTVSTGFENAYRMEPSCPRTRSVG